MDPGKHDARPRGSGHQQAGETCSQGNPTGVSAEMPVGFTLPVPDKTDAELIAFAEGWQAGYDRGSADGYAAGFATADTILKGAVAAALGRPGDDFTAAVKRANRTLGVIEYRRRRAAREAA